MSKTRALALAASLLALTAPAWAQEAEMTAEEVVAQNLEARGGKDAIQAKDTARITGRMTMGPGMEAPFTLVWQRPDQLRMEFVVQGQTGVQAFDGETAWMHMPFMGKAEPERMPEEASEDIQEMADLDGPLVDYATKGHSVELLGSEEVEGAQAYKLKLTKKNGDVSYLWIDADAFLALKEEAKRTMNDQEVETETTLGNYKQVDGLVLPHSIENRMKNAPAGTPGQTITIDKYEFGIEVDEDQFLFPGDDAEDMEDEAAE